MQLIPNTHVPSSYSMFVLIKCSSLCGIKGHIIVVYLRQGTGGQMPWALHFLGFPHHPTCLSQLFQGQVGLHATLGSMRAAESSLAILSNPSGFIGKTSIEVSEDFST